jgi:hypothetical protein
MIFWPLVVMPDLISLPRTRYGGIQIWYLRKLGIKSLDLDSGWSLSRTRCGAGMTPKL